MENGDINNYQKLDEITETDLTKNIYVYNFNNQKNAIKTRSLFPLNQIDQEVAYYGYYSPTNTPANATKRGIVTFIDKTGIVFANNGYKRDVYVRISYQEKTDKRNFEFRPTAYTLECGFSTYVDKNPIPRMVLYASGTGQDV